jgi:hypothetical protein
VLQTFFKSIRTPRTKKTRQQKRTNTSLEQKLQMTEGRAVAQAVRRWLPTAVARVRVRAKHVDKAALVQVFSEYFGFPCQIMPPISSSS